jgi:hypothetical protein
MGKIPAVERDALSDALTTKCAAVWYAFLAEEAYFNGDVATHDKYMSAAESLSRSPQGFLHSQKLEKEIKKWCEE